METIKALSDSQLEAVRSAARHSLASISPTELSRISFPYLLNFDILSPGQPFAAGVQSDRSIPIPTNNGKMVPDQDPADRCFEHCSHILIYFFGLQIHRCLDAILVQSFNCKQVLLSA